MGNNENIGIPKELPNLLLLSDTCVSFAHGTGTVLIRHFSNYPAAKIFHAFRNERGKPYYENSLRLQYTLKDKQSVASAVEKLKAELDGNRFEPGIIYSNFNSVIGLEFLNAFIKRFKIEAPLIQYFQDYFPGIGNIAPLIEALKPNLREIWVLTEEMARSIRPILNDPVQVVSNLSCNIPRNYKKKHAGKSDPGFSAILFGNVWTPGILDDIKTAWRYVSSIIPGISPIKWYAHSFSVDYVKEAGIECQPEISYEGFISTGESGFYDFLSSFDMAIIPFTKELTQKNRYAQYSFPSRLTELAAAGLPVFLVSAAGTPVQRFIAEKKIGICASPADPPAFQQSLLSFIENKELRETCGYNARKLAEEAFDLIKHQKFLYNTFAELAKKGDNR